MLLRNEIWIDTGPRRIVEFFRGLTENYTGGTGITVASHGSRDAGSRRGDLRVR
jgi:hypothetical protein